MKNRKEKEKKNAIEKIRIMKREYEEEKKENGESWRRK
jgi:hypothetical protein